MPTETKAASSRRNGALSRGPRTSAGKARSAANALRHGLTAEALVVLPGEDPAVFHELGARMRSTLAPEGELEARLVERVVGLVWRLRRLGTIEAGVIERHILKRAEPRMFAPEWERKVAASPVATLGDAFGYAADSLGTLSRYEVGLDRALYAAIHELQRLQPARSGEPVRVPVALDVTVTAGEEAA